MNLPLPEFLEQFAGTSHPLAVMAGGSFFIPEQKEEGVLPWISTWPN